MSFFRKPVMNKYPEAVVSLFWVYQYVRSKEAMPETEALRVLVGEEEQRRFKGLNFDYVTPSGTFSYCNDASLTEHSTVICMDLDALDDVEGVREKLLADPVFETLLLFRSPRGRGLKWFVEIDLARCDHKTWFAAIRNYLMMTYQLTDKQVDKTCSPVSKACYLSYDPDAYLKPELIEFF